MLSKSSTFITFSKRGVITISILIIAWFAYDIMMPSPNIESQGCQERGMITKYLCGYVWPDWNPQAVSAYIVWIIKKLAFMVSTVFIIFVFQGRAFIGR